MGNIFGMSATVLLATLLLEVCGHKNFVTLMKVIKIGILAPPNHAEHLHVIALLQDVTGFYLLTVDGGGDRLFDFKLPDQVVYGGSFGQGQGCFAFGCAG